MKYHTSSLTKYISCFYFILLLFLYPEPVSANTETFQFRIPSNKVNFSLSDKLDTFPEKYQLIDLSGETPEFDRIFKLNVTNGITDNLPIVLKLKHDLTLFSKSDLYTLKLCWSAISPIIYKPKSFNSLTLDERTTYLMFNFYLDAYPVDLNKGKYNNDSEYYINCSVSKMFLGVLPSDLVPTITFILVVLISLYFTNKYVVNFYDFLCYQA